MSHCRRKHFSWLEYVDSYITEHEIISDAAFIDQKNMKI